MDFSQSKLKILKFSVVMRGYNESFYYRRFNIVAKLLESIF